MKHNNKLLLPGFPHQGSCENSAPIRDWMSNRMYLARLTRTHQGREELAHSDLGAWDVGNLATHASIVFTVNVIQWLKNPSQSYK